jgi:hypothetical protein
MAAVTLADGYHHPPVHSTEMMRERADVPAGTARDRRVQAGPGSDGEAERRGEACGLALDRSQP